MRGLAAVQKKLKELEDEKTVITQKMRDIIRRTLLLCTKCKKRSQLASWDFIQDRFYVRPSGCTEGDYWQYVKTECCHMICPKCGTELYIYNHPQRDRVVGLVHEHQFDVNELFRKSTERLLRD